MNLTAEPIRFNNTALRDGHQSLAATRTTTAQMLPVAALLDRAGFAGLETWGGVGMQAMMNVKLGRWKNFAATCRSSPQRPQDDSHGRRHHTGGHSGNLVMDNNPSQTGSEDRLFALEERVAGLEQQCEAAQVTVPWHVIRATAAAVMPNVRHIRIKPELRDRWQTSALLRNINSHQIR